LPETILPDSRCKTQGSGCHQTPPIGLFTKTLNKHNLSLLVRFHAPYADRFPSPTIELERSPSASSYSSARSFVYSFLGRINLETLISRRFHWPVACCPRWGAISVSVRSIGTREIGGEPPGSGGSRDGEARTATHSESRCATAPNLCAARPPLLKVIEHAFIADIRRNVLKTLPNRKNSELNRPKE